MSERIPALDVKGRSALITCFCPPALATNAISQDSNQDCFIRLYLVKRRGERISLKPTVDTFGLRNDPLCLNHMQVFGLDVRLYASAIGEALAMEHWEVKISARGVEYVLGGAHRLLRSRFLRIVDDTDHVSDVVATSTWLLDFNQCQTIEMTEAGVQQAVNGFFDNDPYYPKPHRDSPTDQAVWEAFQNAYLFISHRILGMSQFPSLFIGNVIQKRCDAPGE